AAYCVEYAGRGEARNVESPPMAHSERVLMGPGPCNPYPEVIEAFTRPLLGHLDPDFLAVLDETCDRLRAVFRTSNALTLPISGTGSAGMETAFVNLVEPGDTAVVGVNGLFGERMCDVASRCGAEVVRVDEEWGRAIDPQRLLSAHPDPKVIAVVHAETSTGVANEIAAVGAGKGDALLLVDCVTSLGGIQVEIDGWGVDVAYAGTQKCLGVPPGLAPLTVNDGARASWACRGSPRRGTASLSSPPCGCRLASTTPRRGRRCSTTTASRSAAASGSSRGGSGESGAWGTRPGPGTSRCCWEPWRS